jgi:hypothetical protein
VSGVLNPADPQALLRRIVGLEKRLRNIQTALAGAQYAHDEGGGDRVVTVATTFQDYTGQPVITVAVPESGRVRVAWGFTGFNNASSSATVRAGVNVTGANTIVATLFNSASAAGDNNVAGTEAVTPTRSASRTKIYEGLTPGSTTFTLQGRVNTLGAAGSHAIQNSWLLVEPMP